MNFYKAIVALNSVLCELSHLGQLNLVGQSDSLKHKKVLDNFWYDISDEVFYPIGWHNPKE